MYQNIKLITFSMACVVMIVGCRISGKVTIKSGAPIPGVTISVDGTTYSTTTANDGTYGFDNLPDGHYTIRPSLAGHMFNPDSISISVAGNTVNMLSPEDVPVSSEIVQVDAASINFVGGEYQCSIPSYGVYYWNSEDVLPNNNCYNYATNVVSEERWGEPGFASGYDKMLAIEMYQKPCVAQREAAIWDGIEYIGEEGTCPDNKTRLALFTDSTMGLGYHWYREDRYGTWSHKPGGGEASNRDAEGRIIYDVRDMATFQLADQFCGYFCACSNTVQGAGHEIIDGPN